MEKTISSNENLSSNESLINTRGLRLLPQAKTKTVLLSDIVNLVKQKKTGQSTFEFDISTLAAFFHPLYGDTVVQKEATTCASTRHLVKTKLPARGATPETQSCQDTVRREEKETFNVKVPNQRGNKCEDDRRKSLTVPGIQIVVESKLTDVDTNKVKSSSNKLEVKIVEKDGKHVKCDESKDEKYVKYDESKDEKDVKYDESKDEKYVKYDKGMDANDVKCHEMDENYVKFDDEIDEKDVKCKRETGEQIAKFEEEKLPNSMASTATKLEQAAKPPSSTPKPSRAKKSGLTEVLFKFKTPSACNFSDIDSTAFVKEITLMQKDLFINIPWCELSDCDWMARDKHVRAPRVMKMIEFFNRLVLLVVTEILAKETPKARANIIAKVIEIADKCRNLGNFESLKALMTGLQSTPVYRLEKTWKNVSSKRIRTFRELASLMSESDNYAEYRYAVKRLQSKGACLPFVGDFLNLVAHRQRYSARYISTGVTPLSLSELVKYQISAEQYDLVCNPVVRKFLLTASYHSEEDNYQLSLRREPIVNVA